MLDDDQSSTLDRIITTIYVSALRLESQTLLAAYHELVALRQDLTGRQE